MNLQKTHRGIIIIIPYMLNVCGRFNLVFFCESFSIRENNNDENFSIQSIQDCRFMIREIKYSQKSHFLDFFLKFVKINFVLAKISTYTVITYIA